MMQTVDIAHSDPESLKWLKDHYFSNASRRIKLERGDRLLVQGASNPRLYLIEEGRLRGTVVEGENTYEVFHSGPGLFVGIYSFFSTIGRSYSTVTADQDSVVSYITRSDIPEEGPDFDLFTTYMIPVLVHEIYVRQTQVIQKSRERQVAIEKLFQNEKMATLGQLAAGLAHELNNAIGVISNATDVLQEQCDALISSSPELHQLLKRSAESSGRLSSKEARVRKKELVEKFGLNENVCRKLAKINLDDATIEQLTLHGQDGLVDVLNTWEVFQAIRNLSVASTHTEHVVQSIRELGARNVAALRSVNLRSTVDKALVLLTNISKNIKIDISGSDTAESLANEGDLIQVWLNIIKNAIESLIESNTKWPTIRIVIDSADQHHLIRIHDNGPGIPKDIQEKVFSPNVSQKSFGLGLGLSIVEKIILGYGGQITLNSEPGNTIFEIRIE